MNPIHQASSLRRLRTKILTRGIVFLFVAPALGTGAPAQAGAKPVAALPSQDVSLEAAREEAKRDIASGHMKIYLAGSIAVYEVGVADSDRALVAKLPRVTAPHVGCTDPQTGPAFEFAKAYNQEIVSYLRNRPKH